MTTYETIEKREHDFGSNNFLEVARKVAKTEDSETEYIEVSRGYIDSQGDRRRRKVNLTLPPDPEVIEFMREALAKV